MLSNGISTRKRPVKEICVEIRGPLVEIGSLVICKSTLSPAAKTLSIVPSLGISFCTAKFFRLEFCCFGNSIFYKFLIGKNLWSQIQIMQKHPFRNLCLRKLHSNWERVFILPRKDHLLQTDCSVLPDVVQNKRPSSSRAILEVSSSCEIISSFFIKYGYD